MNQAKAEIAIVTVTAPPMRVAICAKGISSMRLAAVKIATSPVPPWPLWQAFRLPRLPITQTSAEGYGQIYVGPVNWLLMLATLGLTVGFGKSDNLAAAYGSAVSATMLMTSVLLFIAMREVWRWPLPLAAMVAGALVLVDAGFVSANLLKIADGGYVPLVLATLVYGVMLIRHRGAEAVAARLSDSLVPIDALMRRIEAGGIPRVPGTAVFMTRTERDAPPVLLWHLKHNRSLHERLFILTVMTEPVPWVADAERLAVQEIAPGVWRARALFGFMERPDVPALLRRAHDHGCSIDPSDVTYFVGHETVVAREDGRGLPHWRRVMPSSSGTRPTSPSISGCPPIRWWRSAEKSRFDGSRPAR